VAGDLPDIREVLEDGRNALLVPPDDPEAAAAAIQSILADEEIRERLSCNAAQDATHYTWESRANRIMEFLRRRLQVE